MFVLSPLAARLLEVGSPFSPPTLDSTLPLLFFSPSREPFFPPQLECSLSFSLYFSLSLFLSLFLSFLPQTQSLLPPPPIKPCLVLDLDETLVHSSFRSVPGADFVIPVQIETTVHHVYVAKRPAVDDFMLRMSKVYEIVIYTASLAKYADPLLDLLDVNEVIGHRLFRDSCVQYNGEREGRGEERGGGGLSELDVFGAFPFFPSGVYATFILSSSWVLLIELSFSRLFYLLLLLLSFSLPSSLSFQATTSRTSPSSTAISGELS